MKIFSIILVSAVVALTSGCSVLAPKQVEFFQDKVERFPEAKASEKETQRQAAALAAARADLVVRAAISNDAPAAVLDPARDVAVLTESVSMSLGPPVKPSSLSAASLAVRLNSATAALNKRVEGFKQDNNENAGKKIEGTGIFQVGYFSMWLWIIGILFVLWCALKVYGLINPVVGLGTNIVGRVSSSVLRKSVAEISEGGEWFKEYLKESGIADDTKKLVLDLFVRAHQEAQSRDTQTLVERLTN